MENKPDQFFHGMGNGDIVVLSFFSFFGEISRKDRIPTTDIYGNKPDADVATFSQDEMKKLLYYSNRDFEESGDIAALVPQVLYYGALREAEGLALHWSDLSDSMNTLKIWSQFKKCSYKKDNGPGWYTENEFVGHTKSAKRHRTDLGARTIPVIPELKEVLVKIYGQKTIESDEIFIRNTGEHITSNMVKSKLFKYERWMGMSTVKSAHDLRRTAATFIKEAGSSDEQIKNILGHSDIKVTQNSYIYDQSNITDKSELIEKALADHDKP